MAARKAKIEKFQSKDGFRWRLLATNGRIIADSAEAYSSASALRRAVESVRNAFRMGIEVVDED
jgi:uncharacterized protein YegP (UPF0339 family)